MNEVNVEKSGSFLIFQFDDGTKQYVLDDHVKSLVEEWEEADKILWLI